MSGEASASRRALTGSKEFARSHCHAISITGAHPNSKGAYSELVRKGGSPYVRVVILGTPIWRRQRVHGTQNLNEESTGGRTHMPCVRLIRRKNPPWIFHPSRLLRPKGLFRRAWQQLATDRKGLWEAEESPGAQSRPGSNPCCVTWQRYRSHGCCAYCLPGAPPGRLRRLLLQRPPDSKAR